jgi:sterol desaturase/sphingolipid hydroxylase (fatty acid hydroxylase superfamily)
MNVTMSWEPLLRAAVFFAVLALLLWGERRARLRAARPGREYLPNFLLLLTNTAVLRLVGGSALVGASLFGVDHGVGLLRWSGMPAWPAFVIAIVALDLGVYAQHRLFHRAGWLWRLHAVHHSDLCFDTSTGVRFHLLESLLSLLIKIALVLGVGASPGATLCFEILLSSASLFTHANIRLPPGVERALRMVLVTPDMHRIHHSALRGEHQRNFGFLLSCWDRWLGSYLARSREDPEQMQIGLASFRAPAQQGYTALLMQPLRAVPR